MKKRIVFGNRKCREKKEIKMILGDLGMPVVSMKEAGIEADIARRWNEFCRECTDQGKCSL